jgi:hypothetical protein
MRPDIYLWRTESGWAASIIGEPAPMERFSDSAIRRFSDPALRRFGASALRRFGVRVT